jgi:hypothetical protein
VKSLPKFPERGSYTKELVGIGSKEYRQPFWSRPAKRWLA